MPSLCGGHPAPRGTASPFPSIFIGLISIFSSYKPATAREVWSPPYFLGSGPQPASGLLRSSPLTTSPTQIEQLGSSLCENPSATSLPFSQPPPRCCPWEEMLMRGIVVEGFLQGFLCLDPSCFSPESNTGFPGNLSEPLLWTVVARRQGG